MASTDPQDVYLLGRVAVGDQTAFASFFDRHSPVVLGVLTRMLRGRSEAEEVMQEAFLQVWKQADRYRPERATPRGWLLMMARSRALDRIRSSQSRVRREEEAAKDVEISPQSSPVGAEALEIEERRQRVRDALRGLPAEQRQCVELAFFEGLSHSQIAAQLDTPLGTVKSRILLGMNKLRVEMATY